MALARVFFIGFPNDAGKKAFAEGEYEDSGGFLVRGPVCATEAATAKHVEDEADSVVSVDVVGGGAVGSTVYEPIHVEEDGGITWGLFGTRAAAEAVFAAKKSEAGGAMGGDDEFTIWEIREHVVCAS